MAFAPSIGLSSAEARQHMERRFESAVAGHGGLGSGAAVLPEIATEVRCLSDEDLAALAAAWDGLPAPERIVGLPATLRELEAVRYARERDRDWLADHRPVGLG
jgi:hypothetical protein